MNVRNPNLETAIIKNTRVSYEFSETTSEDIDQLVVPIYLGQGALGQNKIFQSNAKLIFEKVVKGSGCNYLHEEYKQNQFYHPLYLMLYGKNRPKCKMIVEAFCNL